MLYIPKNCCFTLNCDIISVFSTVITKCRMSEKFARTVFLVIINNAKAGAGIVD